MCELLCPARITEVNSVSFLVHRSQVYMIPSVILIKRGIDSVIDYVSVCELNGFHMSSGSNCCQNRTVLLFLCEVNEQPPDKQSGLSPAMRIRRHFIVIFYIIHVASVVLSL